MPAGTGSVSKQTERTCGWVLPTLNFNFAAAQCISFPLTIKSLLESNFSVSSRQKPRLSHLTVTKDPGVSDTLHRAERRTESVEDAIGGHANLLSSQLRAMSETLFPPVSKKTLRRFTSGEAAKLMRVSRFDLAQNDFSRRRSDSGNDGVWAAALHAWAD